MRLTLQEEPGHGNASPGPLVQLATPPPRRACPLLLLGLSGENGGSVHEVRPVCPSLFYFMDCALGPQVRESLAWSQILKCFFSVFLSVFFFKCVMFKSMIDFQLYFA